MVTTKILFVFTIFFLLYSVILASIVPRRTPTPKGRLPPRGTVPANFIPNSKIANEFLIAHNDVRRTLGLKPLTWNNNLACYAEQWAKKRLNDCKMIHSMGPYGENIFWGGGATYWSPTTVVKSWASERAFYNPTSNSCAKNKMCGHYTQIVWKETVCVGCASLRCNCNKGTFIICSYDPPGNYVGEHPYRKLNDVGEKLKTHVEKKPTVVATVEYPDL